MKPILHEGDVVSVCRKYNYQLGDILIFVYKNNEILVHWLLKIENNQFYYKGDNSFRLENTDVEHIVGSAVVKFDGNNNSEFIKASLMIGKLFRQCQYNIEAIKATPEYLEYKIIIWNKYILR